MAIYEVSSGEISSGIVQDYGGLVVLSGGVVKNTEIKNSGFVDVSSGGRADSTIINDGDTGGLFIFDGGIANDVTVNYGGYMKVANGGKAKNVVENGGYVYVADELENGHPNVTFKKNTFSGVVLSGAKMENWATVHSGTTAMDTTAQSGCKFSIRGGIANGNTVNSDGEMYVHSGTVNNTVVNSGGDMYVSGGTANSIIVNSGGYVAISSGGTATQIVENGGYVYIKDGAYVTFLPNTFSDLVLDGTSATIHSGTTANDITFNSNGKILVFSGGFANDITVNSNSKLWIYEGGLANGFTVGSECELWVDCGGWITGRMTFQTGATVDAVDGAYLDFDLTQTTAGATPLVNDLSFIPDKFLFTITVNGTQSKGTYKLAGGAAAFDQPVYIMTASGMTLGTISVGGSLSTVYADYTLKKNGSELTLAVAESKIPINGPPEPYNNDLVYKNKTDNKNVTDSYGVHLSAPGDEIYIDRIGTVIGHNNRVGKDDKIDYGKIVLEHGAKLSFHVEASAAAKFTVYKLTEKNGKYKTKKLQTLTLKDKDKDGIYTADSKKPAELNGSGDYYVSMQYTDKRKNVDEAFYSVVLNGEDKGTRFFTKGDNTDDWTDMKTAGPGGAVGNIGTFVKGPDKEVSSGWVGFGDVVDYMRFKLDKAAELSFLINASEGVKFSILSLNSKFKKEVEVFSVKSLQTTTVKAALPKETNHLKLKAGDYYLKIASTAPKKGDGADYCINLLGTSTFFSDGDDGWNSYVYDKKKVPVDKRENTELTESAGTTLSKSKEVFFDKAGDVKESAYHNFVGFGDEIDYTKVVLEMDATLTFQIKKTEGAVKFTVNQLLDNKKFVTKQTTAIKTAETERETKVLRLSAGTYYLGMQATKAKKDDSVHYDVLVKNFVLEASVEASLSMPEPAVGVTLADDLSFLPDLAETSLAGAESGVVVFQNAGLEWTMLA